MVQPLPLGAVYGKRTVIDGPFKADSLGFYGTGQVYSCLCECGDISFVQRNGLLRGTAQTCKRCAKAANGRRLADSIILKNITKPVGDRGFRAAVGSYKCGAVNRKLEWALSDEECRKLFDSDCYYCGAPPNNVLIPRDKCCRLETVTRGTFIYTGIDRINNTKGYVTGNVVACCKVCNFAKKTMSAPEFIDWILRAADHIRSKKIRTGAQLSVLFSSET